MNLFEGCEETSMLNKISHLYIQKKYITLLSTVKSGIFMYKVMY